MKILFHEDKWYNDIRYEAGKVYDIPEENGMALRWLKRGCTQVIEKSIEETQNLVENIEETTIKSTRKPHHANKKHLQKPSIEEV